MQSNCPQPGCEGQLTREDEGYFKTVVCNKCGYSEEIKSCPACGMVASNFEGSAN